MPNLTQLRLAAREIFNEALRAADAGAAVRRAVRLEDAHLSVCDTVIDVSIQQSIYAIAIGKAAFAMASALDEILAGKLVAGVLSSNAPRGTPALSLWQVFPGGHPEPNEQSLQAAKACFDLLQRADEERALVLFLISGGGSAMIEWPIAEDIALPDLRSANKALVSCGASIGEINAVRRAFSTVKGGRLAARAPHCDQITLITSDVPPGEEGNVASGPTLAPRNDAHDARVVIARYSLRSLQPRPKLPAGSVSSLKSPMTFRINKSKMAVPLFGNDWVSSAKSRALSRARTQFVSSQAASSPALFGATALADGIWKRPYAWLCRRARPALNRLSPFAPALMALTETAPRPARLSTARRSHARARSG